MQFSAVLIIFMVNTYLNSIFTNDLKRKDFFSKNVHSYRLSLFNYSNQDLDMQTFIVYKVIKEKLFCLHFYRALL